MTDRAFSRAGLLNTAGAACFALLAACGGGGGATSTPPPPVSPAPSPTPGPSPSASPTPTPTPSTTLRYVAPPLPNDTIGFSDTEFANSDGPRFHGAPTAWVQGSTGSGRTIAIIDTGIATAEPEFAGRISPNSTGIAGNSSHEADLSAAAQPDSLHGTEIALIAAAANNGQGNVGIAYNATIMAIRADQPGSCASDGGCEFGDVAAGIRWAVDHGATVINLSLGGSGASSSERSAVQAAAAAGVVVVVAAGNDGSTTGPDSFAKALADIGSGNVIIVGSVDAGGQSSSFSNKAGTYGQYYIAALGRNLSITQNASFYEQPGSFQISGTSFAAPQVAGAVALIKQAFPAMTGQEIVELLLETAQDVGAAGIDSVFGSGIMDIHEAFQPQGLTTLAGSDEALRFGDDTGATSPAMGDAVEGTTLSTLVLDKYRRAYHTDLGPGLGTARLSQRLEGAVGREQQFVSLRAGKAALAFTLDASDEARQPWPKQLMLSREAADGAKVLAARVAMKLSPSTDFGFAYAESADGLVGQLQGQERPAFLIAHSATGDDGVFRTTDAAFALRRRAGSWGLTVSAESGQIVSATPLQLAENAERLQKKDGARSFAVTADRAFGPFEASFGLTWLDEDRTVLGARFHDGFGAGGAETAFIDAHAGWNFASGWRLGGAWRQGFTRPHAGGIITANSLIETRAWSLDLQRWGVFGEHDSLALRLAQPLRVESGGLALELPVAFSYDTMLPTYDTRTLSLTPHGRELMGEFAWRGPLFGGFGAASVFYRRDPGHYASVPDDKGVALKWETKF